MQNHSRTAQQNGTPFSRQEFYGVFGVYFSFSFHASRIASIRALISFTSANVRGFSIQGVLLLGIRLPDDVFPRRIRSRLNRNEYICFASSTFGRYDFISKGF
jgi:hypothetical protein